MTKTTFHVVFNTIKRLFRVISQKYSLKVIKSLYVVHFGWGWVKRAFFFKVPKTNFVNGLVKIELLQVCFFAVLVNVCSIIILSNSSYKKSKRPSRYVSTMYFKLH